MVGGCSKRCTHLVTTKFLWMAWVHFQRAKIGVCVWCRCVQNTGKEVHCIKPLTLVVKR